MKKKQAFLKILMIAAATACGGTDIENQAPIIVGTIDPIRLFVGQIDEVNVAGLFDDPDGDSLTYTVMNPDPGSLRSELLGSLLVVEGLDEAIVTIAVTAMDLHGAGATLKIEVSVLLSIRYDFDDDLAGWTGVIGLDLAPELVSVRDGHLILDMRQQRDVIRFGLRDLGIAFGPNWNVKTRVKVTDCFGLMAFTTAFQPGIIPDMVWSLDIGPQFWSSGKLYVSELDAWVDMSSGGYLPDDPVSDGYLIISMGHTEEDVFYAYAHEDFKLFETHLNDPPFDGFYDPPYTVEHIAVTAGPQDPLLCRPAEIEFDWVEVTIQQ